MLQRFVSAVVEQHTSAELRKLQDIIRGILPDDQHRATMIEVIEGKIALREIGKG